jgi:hypothetical protein
VGGIGGEDMSYKVGDIVFLMQSYQKDAESESITRAIPCEVVKRYHDTVVSPRDYDLKIIATEKSGEILGRIGETYIDHHQNLLKRELFTRKEPNNANE